MFKGCKGMCICCVACKLILHFSHILAKSLNVLRIGVMEPGALLNDAYKEYEVRCPYLFFVVGLVKIFCFLSSFHLFSCLMKYEYWNMYIYMYVHAHSKYHILIDCL